jgi:hypothetical protein
MGKIVKRRKVIFAGRFAHLGEMRSAYIVLVGNLKGRDLLSNPDIGERMMIDWIVENGASGADCIDVCHKNARIRMH